jgi:hypothetical protein
MRRCLALALLLLPILSGGWLLYGPSSPAGIRGLVLGPDGPVAGARVRFQAAPTATVTDERGRFHLRHADPGRHVTAWKDGFFIAGARPDAFPLDLRLVPLADEDHPEYQWVDPAPSAAEVHNCGNCHAEIYREWSASGHARSASGTYFRDLYEGTDRRGKAGVSWGLLTDYPGGSGVCSSCHAPAIPDGDPSYLDLRGLEGTALRGVHCDYCHKIAGTGGTIGLTHGRFGLRLLRPADGQIFFGPLDDVDRGEDAYSPFYRDSRYCASCHEGIVFGVHVYSTYSEWLDSPARREGKQCQDCHMAPTGRMTNIAPNHGGLPRDPRTLANHRFFDGGRLAMLRRCVQASAIVEPAAGGLRVQVRLAAEGAGHRVPTGFVDRQLILVVEGEDADGRPVPALSGPTLPAVAGPQLAGRSGRLYAKLIRDFDGKAPVPFWLAGPGAEDNRLSPDRPDNLNLNYPAGLARVRVRVFYRRFWQEVAAAKGWPDTDLVVLDRTFDTPQPPG